jgi:carbamoyltransferase
MADPWVLGIAASHNGAACLLHGDRVVVAIQEERLSGVKRCQLLPSRHSMAIEYCLAKAGITVLDLNVVVTCPQGPSSDPANDVRRSPQLGIVYDDILSFSISHHLGHATHAFATSGYPDAAVLVIDGMGSPVSDLPVDELKVLDTNHTATTLKDAVEAFDSWETISLYRASRDVGLIPLLKRSANWGGMVGRPKEGMSIFGSVGGMYAAVAHQIFGDASLAGNVMALAAYGLPSLPTDHFFKLTDGVLAFSEVVPKLFEHDRRWPNMSKEYDDLAASVQNALEELVLELAREAKARSGLSSLCYSGGVALNGIANERIIREGGFDLVHIPPGSEDCGTAIGAAYQGLWRISHQQRPSVRLLATDALGGSYSSSEVTAAISEVHCVPVQSHENLLIETVDRLRAGQICGWFQEGSEFGPRALGYRSILADPRRAAIADLLNEQVKGREKYLPFAPAILLEHASDWFDTGTYSTDNPFMLRIWKFHEQVCGLVPAVVHVDGSGRAQTVSKQQGRFFELLQHFHEASGLPLLLNTSFNVAGEPIVESPSDALWCMITANLDFCVLEDRIVTRDQQYESILDFIPTLTTEVSGQLRADQRAVGACDGPSGTSAETLSIVVSNRWGYRGHPLHPSTSIILGLVDGNRTCEEIYNKVRDLRHAPKDRSSLRLLIARLRRMGILSLRPNPCRRLI